jgi:hypothetical protein
VDKEVEIADAARTAVATAMKAPEVILTAMYEAVLAYHQTKDPAVLIEFAEAARMTAIVNLAPNDAKTLEIPPARALGAGRSLDEIFAEQPANRHGPR